MAVRLKNTEKAKDLFKGWDDAMFRACLEGSMGEVLVPEDASETVGTDSEAGTDRAAGTDHAAGADCTGETSLRSACLHFADFYLFGGKPDARLLEIPMGINSILTPADAAWEKLLSEHYPAEERAERYAIRKDTVFDREKLEALARQLPEGITLCRIDGKLYDRCMENPWSMDFVQTFPSKEAFLQKGLGIVAVRDGEILAGCSSYARCSDAIEVEVDTRKDQRRQHLATACAAKLILLCLEQGLYPSWDAMNMESVGLEEKLGYRFSHAYSVYMRMDRTPGNC